MAERLSTGIGPLVRGAVLLTQRVKLFRSHYRIARGYTSRRDAARIAWSWASMLKAAEPPICADTNAPKWPGNCWNVRCQLGGTCCRIAGVLVSSESQGSNHGAALDSCDGTTAGSEGLLLDVPADLLAAEPSDARGEVRPEGQPLVHIVAGDALDGAAARAHALALLPRIDAAIKRITTGTAPMRVPADDTDPDLVLADCKRLLRHFCGVTARYQCAACDWSGTAPELVQQCVPCCPKCLGDVQEAGTAGVMAASIHPQSQKGTDDA